jgi:hypothetical protein
LIQEDSYQGKECGIIRYADDDYDDNDGGGDDDDNNNNNNNNNNVTYTFK